MNRREWLVGVPGLLWAGNVCSDATTVDAFPYGVASGDPMQSSIVLWTALASARANDERVRWWVRQRSNGRLVREGFAVAPAARGHTVKVCVDGLMADERYVYGFQWGETASPIGRTRTLPSTGTQPVRLAVFSCSRLSSGWFHAYRHAAEDPDLDYAIHLGDYIYESASNPIGAASGRVELPDRTLVSLEDYRARHASYRRDPDLQALHAALPMMPIWDDHEFADDASKKGENTQWPQRWPERAAAARQAYFEWLPLTPSETQRLWRHRKIGDLADLYLLDTRIEGRDRQLDPADMQFASTERHMLGVEQERWLAQALGRPRTAAWTVLASSVIFSKLAWPLTLRSAISTQGPRWARELLEQRIARCAAGLAGNPDAWDGYPAAQRRLLDMLARRKGRTVILSGDTHSAWAFSLADPSGDTLGWEVGVPSVTSEASLEYTQLSSAALEALFKQRNPHLNYLEPSARGYAVLELSAHGASVEWRYVESVLARTPSWRLGQRLDMSPP